MPGYKPRVFMPNSRIGMGIRQRYRVIYMEREVDHGNHVESYDCAGT
jgi:hypothetical protein